MVKPNQRTKSIGTKVSEEEFSRLEQAAQKASKTLGECCREVILGSATGQLANGAGGNAGAEALMAEVVALRAILLNVLFKQANGERLTSEEMQRLIERSHSGPLENRRQNEQEIPGMGGDLLIRADIGSGPTYVCGRRKSQERNL
jgi:hypothetical protein